MASSLRVQRLTDDVLGARVARPSFPPAWLGLVQGGDAQ
jgi:hypothetical protein